MIKEEFQAILRAHARYLVENRGAKVLVQGNTDERGGREYNLALGTRRANAVKDYLLGLGVNTNRITVISKGKEQPFCSTEDESCWSQNRRGHFIITAK